MGTQILGHRELIAVDTGHIVGFENVSSQDALQLLDRLICFVQTTVGGVNLFLSRHAVVLGTASARHHAISETRKR